MISLVDFICLSVYLSSWNAASLVCTIICKLTRRQDRGTGEGAMREGGFEGICFSITNETFWANSATCSCTVELREEVHFRRFFSPNLGFLQIFSRIS